PSVYSQSPLVAALFFLLIFPVFFYSSQAVLSTFLYYSVSIPIVYSTHVYHLVIVLFFLPTVSSLLVNSFYIDLPSLQAFSDFLLLEASFSVSILHSPSSTLLVSQQALQSLSH